MRLALDTTILIYAFDHDATEKHVLAARLLDHALVAADAIMPLQVLNEFSNVAIRKLGWPPGQVHRVVSDWRRLRRVVATAFEDLIFALEQQGRERMDHWDAVLMATCIREDVRWLITEDAHNDWRGFGTLYLNPFDPAHAWRFDQLALP